MNDLNDNILDSDLHESEKVNRRSLLPGWIKFFTWIFMFFGLVIPAGFVYGMVGGYFSLSIYGISTIIPFSLVGLLIMGLFALKAVVAFGLWFEKYWAADYAILDAGIGIVFCVGVLFLGLGSGSFSLRLELIALIPYLNKMWKIRDVWVDSSANSPI